MDDDAYEAITTDALRGAPALDGYSSAELSAALDEAKRRRDHAAVDLAMEYGYRLGAGTL